MRLYLRVKEFNECGFTYFWDGQRHEWSDLTSATVYSEDDVKASGIEEDEGVMCSGSHKVPEFVPEGRWNELPLRLQLRSLDDFHAELDRRQLEEEASDAIHQ